MAITFLVPVAPLAPKFTPSKANYYESLSALVKAIRLRERDSALRWFAHLAVWYPANRFQIARRLLVSGGEDALSSSVQVFVAMKYHEMLGQLKAPLIDYVKTGVQSILAMLDSPNWYHSKSVAVGIALWIHVAENEAFHMPDAFYKVTDVKVLAKTLMSISDPYARFCALTAHYVHSTQKGLDYARFLLPITKPETRAPLNVIIGHPKELGEDENYLHCAFVRATLPTDWSDGLTEGPADGPLTASAEALIATANSTQLDVPSYYLDGMHTWRGNDVRFAGEANRMLGCCYAFAETGVLNHGSHIKGVWCTVDAIAEKFNVKLPVGA